MKSVSLKWKLFAMGFVPLIFFLASSLISILESKKTLSQIDLFMNKVEVIKQTSKIVNYTQVERGLSAAFMSGVNNKVKLDNQRLMNNSEMKKLKAMLENAPIHFDLKREINKNLDMILQSRTLVDSKSSLEIMLREYTNVISFLLDLELVFANQISIPSLSEKLKSLRVLEEAKESGGKLRANMSAILGKNKSISDAKFQALLSLKAGVDEGLSSKSLFMDDELERLVNKFFNSSDWMTVKQTFLLILKNSENGAYDQDPVRFFSIITSALSIVDEILTYNKGLLEVDSEKQKQIAEQNLIQNISWAIASAIFVLFFVFLLQREITSKILKVIDRVTHNAEDLLLASDEIASTSRKLNKVATEQASSIQETVASIDEVGSMVQRNSESASHSTQVSKKSNDAALLGRKKVDSVIVSMSDISKSNDEIESISKMISEISNKTRVINDIVFQTKLLSINASVEAAKAGEHGKGFAVVAEEVGNLAAISGKASLEITDLIQSSIHQVNEVVTKNKGKILKGEQITQECGASLDEILKNVSSVNELMNEIASSSAEQSTGVNEVRKAMQQLDQTMHLNTGASQDVSNKAIDLKNNSTELKNAINELVHFVYGEDRSALGNNAKQTAENIVHLDRFKSKYATSKASQVNNAVGIDRVTSENKNQFKEL
jgi:methyl-accepting chemotaxis protein